MKKLITVILICISLQVSAQETGVQFRNDTLLASALASAKAERKLLFVDCMTSWCKPCKYMAKNIFTQKEVGEFYNANFVNVKFDMQKFDGPAMCERYKIHGFPTLLFLDGNGEVAHITGGACSAEELVELGRLAMDSTRNRKGATQRIHSGDHSAEAIHNYLNVNGNAEDRDTLLSEYFSGKTKNELLNKEAWELTVNYITDVEHPQFQHIIQEREAYSRVFGKEEVDNKIYAGMLDAIFLLGRKFGGESGQAVYFNSIDSVLCNQVKLRIVFEQVMRKLHAENAGHEQWSNFIDAGTAYFTKGRVTPLQLNDYGWFACQNYKKFDGKTELQTIKKWSEMALTAEPNNHLFNDTYAHILFELGEVEEAIKFEEIAEQKAKLANDQNAKQYAQALEHFRGFDK